MSIVAVGAACSAGSIRKVGVIGWYAVDDTFSFEVIFVHYCRGSRAVKHTVVGTVICVVGRWAELLTSSNS